MKKNYKIVLAFILGILISGTSVYAATKYLASEVTYKDTTVEKALNELYTNKGTSSDFIGTEWSFQYKGKEDVFVAPCDGIYKLETWGAQGGTVSGVYYGGYGGYSSGNVVLSKNEKIYINVGGKGKDGDVAYGTENFVGGYNGGGNVSPSSGLNHIYGSGGGATHIATVSGLLSELEQYKGTYNEETKTYNSDTILIVSGGGGGSKFQQNYNQGSYGYGSSAGGYTGNNTSALGAGAVQAFGGNQKSPGEGANKGSFGLGASTIANGAGGGGFYGAGCGSIGAGGSSYIGSSKLTKKVMYCYNCEESDKEHIKTISTTNVSEEPISNYAKKGNGYAKITLVSLK